MSDFTKLANRLFEVVMANLSLMQTWGFYLTNAEFDNEPELRNKIGTIWICSLLDTLEAESRFLPEVASEAKQKGYEALVHNAAQLQRFCALIGEVLNLFSREEQLFLQDLRNQWVHSYLANRHRPSVMVKYARKGTITSEKLTDDDYHSTIRPLYQANASLDETLQPMIARALNKNLRYWTALAVMQRDKDVLYQVLLAGHRISIKV